MGVDVGVKVGVSVGVSVGVFVEVDVGVLVGVCVGVLVGAPGDTLVFSEKRNKWVFRTSFAPDGWDTYNGKLISYYKGKIYIHDDYDNVCRFYGVDENYYIDLVFNKHPVMKKVPKSMIVSAKYPIGASRVVVEDSHEFPVGMLSKILS